MYNLLESVEKDLPLEGKLLFENQRIFINSTASIGTLRKDLIETLGEHRTKSFLIRYGWNMGSADAKLAMKKMDTLSIEEVIMLGPKYHMMKGYATIDVISLEINKEKNQIYMEGKWINSYETEEHNLLFGLSKEPICHTMIGYASGYVSEIFGEHIIFKEIACVGMGAEHCHWIGKNIRDWNGEIDEELKYFEPNSLVDEIEKMNIKLKNERDNLNKTLSIHKKLMSSVIFENNLQSIAKTVYDLLNIPILIEDHRFQILACAGLEQSVLENYQNDFKEWLAFSKKINHSKKKNDINFTTFIELKTKHKRLITPIYLQNKIIGYCSLIITEEHHFEEIDKMILEQTSAASSIYLLNEKTSMETEQRIRGHFLDEILNGQLSNREMYRYGYYMGINLDEPYNILVLNITSKKSSGKVVDELKINEELISLLSKYLKNIGVSALIGQRVNNIILFVQRNILFERKTTLEDFCKDLSTYTKNLCYGYFVQIGVSSETSHIEHANQAYEEALASFKISDKTSPIIFFDSLGPVGILIQTDNKKAISSYVDKVLKKLIDIDQRKNTDYIKTLYSYLLNGGNLEATAKETVLSISGLRYRLQKIENLLERDIREPLTNYTLFLALQLYIVYLKNER